MIDLTNATKEKAMVFEQFTHGDVFAIIPLDSEAMTWMRKYSGHPALVTSDGRLVDAAFNAIQECGGRFLEVADATE
jgi:hypothetical protein